MVIRATRSHKILWAIDPFFEDGTLNRRTSRAIAALAHQKRAEIEPVFVAGSMSASVEVIPFAAVETRILGDRKLDRMLRGVQIPGILPLRVLEAERLGVRGEADALAAYARECKADLLVVGTRARKGLERLLLGSFAETLLFHTDLPLYVVNPHEQVASKIRHILFPTDFSPESRRALDDAAELALELEATLTIYHAVQLEAAPWADPAFVALPMWDEMFRETLVERRHDAAAWARRLESRGVEVSYLVEQTGTLSAVEGILSRAKRRGSIIVMAARSGPVAAMLLGSVTRQVIRRSPVPVWVSHPTARAKSARSRKAA